MADSERTSLDRLLLDPATRVTCPKCDHEFSLEEGFAKKALEQLEDASRGALAGLEQQVRSEAARRAETISAERDKVRGREIDELKKLLEDQGKRHQESLQQVISTERQTAALQAAELQKSLQDRDIQLAAVRQREAAIDERERNLEARVATEAKAKAAELFATERQSMERQLSERNAEVRALKEQELALREEREKLKEEKESLGIEIRRQVDAQMQQRESTVRTQEMEKAKLREADLQQTIEGMKGTIEELQRKSQQGIATIAGRGAGTRHRGGSRAFLPAGHDRGSEEGCPRRRRDSARGDTYGTGRRGDSLGDQARQGLEPAVDREAQGRHASGRCGPRRAGDHAGGDSDRVGLRAALRPASGRVGHYRGRRPLDSLKYCAKACWMFTSSGSSRPERARRWRLCTTT